MVGMTGPSLATMPSPPLELGLRPLVSEMSRQALAASQAPSTRRAYQADWADFAGWCAGRGLDPLPAWPETVGNYLTDLAAAGLSSSTLARRVAAIRSAHLAAGHETSPTASAHVRRLVGGLRRLSGVAPAQKAAITTADVRALVGTLDRETPLGLRDRALILLGFATGLRRAELAAIDVGDLAFVPDEGLRLRVRRSKTDQEGAGRTVAVLRGRSAATCPIRALQAWLEVLGQPSTGPLFRYVRRGGHITDERMRGKVVAIVVQRAAKAAGLDPARYGGHSLRAGLVTTATRNGARVDRIMAQTGHVRVDTLMGYVREAQLFDDNASGYLEL